MDEHLIELISERAASKAIEKHEASNKIQLEERIKTHILECPAGKKLDRICWMLSGAFGSGLIGGTAFGAWVAKLLATGGIKNVWLYNLADKILG
jgi:hypothetical protein